MSDNLKVMYSSKSDEWATPQALYDSLNDEFDFNLDPCSTDSNHKCEKYYTQKEDGLTQNWGGTECFAIHLIARLQNGLKKHLEKREKIKPLSFC